jgi:protein-S-isoprenylcysteine O-methyltransferase Ste14
MSQPPLAPDEGVKANVYERYALTGKGNRIMSFKAKWIDFLYNVAIGSKKVRNLLTPIGATFYALITALFVVIALQVDNLFNLPKLLSTPLNVIVSIPILSFALFMMGWSLLYFLEVRGTPVPFNPPPKLVTSGPYAYVRNPMLAGIFILLFGLGALFRSLSLVFLFTPAFIAVNVWELKTIEEPELEKRLGEEYIQYKKRIPMFIPHLRAKSKKKI